MAYGTVLPGSKISTAWMQWVEDSIGTLGSISECEYLVSVLGADASASKAGQVIYGGVGDEGGVDGANHAAVINAAITDMGANGGTMGVRDGTYSLTAKVSLASAVKLILARQAIMTLAYDGTMFELSGVTRAGIYGGYLTGVKGTYAAGQGIVITATSYRCDVENAYVTNFGARGIDVEASSQNNIIGNYVYDVDDEGIFLHESSWNNVQGNHVNTTGKHGIVSTEGSYNTIANNRVFNAGGNYVAGYAHGIAVDGNAGATPCYGNVVNGNVIKTCLMAGIEVADAAHDTVVSSNLIEDTGDYGLFFGGALALSHGGIIAGNTLKNVGTGADQGIMIAGAAVGSKTWGTTVSGNTVYVADVDGIRLKYVEYITVSGNTLIGCGGYGLGFEDANADYCNIIGNTFHDNALGGVNVNGANTHGIIRNNIGYVTENSGTDTIASGTTSKAFAHGCGYTPTAQDFTITLTENPTNSPGAIWVDTIGAANATVNCENDPGASNLDFGWAVRRK